jgi:hypothetical protein
MSALGQSRPIRSAPVRTFVRCYSNSDQMLRCRERSDVPAAVIPTKLIDDRHHSQTGMIFGCHSIISPARASRMLEIAAMAESSMPVFARDSLPSVDQGRQKTLKPARCQRRMVSGCTTWTAPIRLGQSRVIHMSNARSPPRSRKRGGACRKAIVS